MTDHQNGPQLIDRAEFDAIAAGGKGAVVVDIWAEWCAPCLMLAPFVHKLAAEHEGVVRVVKLVWDNNRDLGAKYDLLGIPALLFFNNGELVDTKVGFDGYTGLRASFFAFVSKVTGVPAGKPSPSEQLFIAAEKTAEAAHDAAETPAREELFRVIKHAKRNADRTLARAVKALAAGKIDEAEKTRREERAQKKLTAASDTAREQYFAVATPLQNAYILAGETAAGIFGERRDTEAEATASTCKIGDSSCRV